MKRGMFILVIAMIGCATANYHGRLFHEIKLEFEGCGPELSFSAIQLSLPKGHQKDKVVDEYGFCEYRFTYPDGSIHYISSNIYYGSSLNYENRYKLGIETYSNNRKENEEIINKGEMMDGIFWMECIQMRYVIGYVNSPNAIPSDAIFKDIKLIGE
ncbi:hypothetical protein [Ekhidna sp.]|jgi:hypothetical protein|uniref:hypothetical protein n=1 Tax=Ekhidna sp. TaxID=2608089 RepID=UPI0032EF67A4